MRNPFIDAVRAIAVVTVVLGHWLMGALTPDDHRAVAVFDTRVAKARRLPGSAARAAARVVRHRRLGRLVGQESFYVDDLAGPLLDGELDRARAWGASLPVKV